MSAFSDAIQDYFAALAGNDGGDFAARVNAALEAAAHATPEEAAWAAGPLVELLARGQLSLSALGLMGELLGRGVNFWGFVPYHLAALGHHLAQAAEVAQAVRAALPAGQCFAELPPEQATALLGGLPEPARSHVSSWQLIGYWLGPAMPFFQQVPDYRRLARMMGLDAGWLHDAGIGPDWLPMLPAFLAEAEPLPDPSAAIDAVLADIRRAVASPPQNEEAVAAVVRPLFEATTFVPPGAFSAAAAELARIAASAHPAWAGTLAMACGSFVERGADPAPGADALVAGLPRLLDPVVAFVEACRARPTTEGASPVQAHAEAVLAEMPQWRPALAAISPYCLGTIAHLARSAAARRKHGQDSQLLARLDTVRWDTGNTGFLWKMLQVLDEELVVLAPAQKLGWRVRIDGIGDNFQLHALIGGHLVGRPEDGKYPGRISTHQDEPEPGPGVPLSARALATQTDAPCTASEPGFSSHIQLWNWTALQPDGTLPDNPIAVFEHFIWNEGVPADIRPFEDTRVVLLGESTIHRHWNGGRIFPFMKATFQVVETMPGEAVERWLGRIAAAPR